MELFKASRQWATRPADETFNSIADAHKAAKAYADIAAQATVNPAELRIENVDGELFLKGKTSTPAKLTHWAFGQLCRMATSPAGFMRSLPATLAKDVLNNRMGEVFGTDRERKTDNDVNLLLHRNGSLLVRAMTSDKYRRIWNHEILGRMLDFRQAGWTNPKPFNGSVESPAIYVSDHDMFAFQVNDTYRIAEPGNDAGLGRGFFVENSEVGASSLRITTFLYRYVCSNHIVWGAREVNAAAFRHVGKVRENMDIMFYELTKYANESASDDEAKIKRAKSHIIEADKEKVLDYVFGKLKGNISRDALESSYELAEQNPVDGNPRSAWGLAQGITRYSQSEKFADNRVALDRAAGKLIEMSF